MRDAVSDEFFIRNNKRCCWCRAPARQYGHERDPRVAIMDRKAGQPALSHRGCVGGRSTYTKDREAVRVSLERVERMGLKLGPVEDQSESWPMSRELAGR